MSTSAAAPSPSLEWAESLIGRYWEVYWRQEGNEAPAAAAANKKATGAAPLTSASEPSTKRGHRQRNDDDNHKPQRHDGDDDPDGIDGELVEADDQDNSTAASSSSEEEEIDADDWYDAKVEAFSSAPGQRQPFFTFKVRFVGDEDDAEYDMVLTPHIVRPSSRAWIRRTLALLGKPRPPPSSGVDGDTVGGGDEAASKQKNREANNVKPNADGSDSDSDSAAWFAALPHDTSTLEDDHNSESGLAAATTTTTTLAKLRDDVTVRDRPNLTRSGSWSCRSGGRCT
jgi:hypothetical protein